MTGLKRFIPGLVKGSSDDIYQQEQAKEIREFSGNLPRIDLAGVNFDSFRPWINDRLAELMGGEDDIVSGLITNTLAAHDPNEKMEPGEIIMLLIPFTGKANARTFVRELWRWIEVARQVTDGVPSDFREAYSALLTEERKQAEERRRAAFEEHRTRGLDRSSRHSSTWDPSRHSPRGDSSRHSPRGDSSRHSPRGDPSRHSPTWGPSRQSTKRRRDYIPSPPSARHRRESHDRGNVRRDGDSRRRSRSPIPRQDYSPPRSLFKADQRVRPISPAPSHHSASSSSYSSEAEEALRVIDGDEDDDRPLEQQRRELQARALRLMNE